MPEPTMSAPEFVEKWRDNARRETASSQEHFIDLCRLVGAHTPNEADRTGTWYTFEAHAKRESTGGPGEADVWRRGHFVWEYKSAGKSLAEANLQARDYLASLSNPPLVVVSDMDRIEVRTNFTNTKTVLHVITLDDLASTPAQALRVLHGVMQEPKALEPGTTPERVTEEAARRFAEIAESMGKREDDPSKVAHFLNRVLFCLFAEDVRLLPTGILTGMIESRRSDPQQFDRGLARLFRQMSERDEDRYFGNALVQWFNGGLFDGGDTLPFTRAELKALHEVALLDWSQVEPSILGTLFERGLDPEKRGQLGAHYTDRAKILMVVEPVVMTPLRREFADMQARVEELMRGRAPAPLTQEGRRRDRLPTWERGAEEAWRAFLERLRAVRVLDPACGSGNFLYVTLRLLKDLESEAIQWGAERLRISGEFPQVGPQNVIGVEINRYAKELASVSIWVGQFQWMIEHGHGFPSDPVLEPLDNIECRDAILSCDADGQPIRDVDGNPSRAEWPDAEFVVGNPPFLGTKRMRGSLSDEYVDQLYAAWDGRVPREADLVTYWHENAREMIAQGRARRAGLLATNSIRGGASRRVLDQVKETGDIFVAWSDEPWVVDGASVRVSIVGQDDGSETGRRLDGEPVGRINSSLTTGVDLTQAERLAENRGISFMGDTKGGAFDIPGDVARQMLRQPMNVNGRPNSDVVVPWVNGLDITRRPRGMFIIDFGTEMTEAEAADYEAPFAYVEQHVQPERATSGTTQAHWWSHERPRRAMREALSRLPRFIVTPRVAKHRLFVWASAPTLPDSATIAIAREDEYTFGVLHSRAHELWALRMGTSLEDRPRYTPTTTFETFPFPWPLDTPEEALTAEQRSQRDAITAAARDLDVARRKWLNPTDLVREEPDIVPSLPPRVLPVSDEAARELSKRTLTNLYNVHRAWLVNLHRDLDEAVFAAYGWEPDIGEEEILERLLALNLERGGG